MSAYDVIVVGAGPAGSRVAYQLAKSGRQVAVLEKRQNAGDGICCTGIISKECIDLFDIDGGCFLQEARSAKVFAPSGEFLRVEKADVQALIVDRAAFDRQLVERAVAKGAQVITDCYVSDIAVFRDRVLVTAFEQGREKHFESQTVVIANGFASKLTEKVGLGRIKEFITGAQVEMGTSGVDETEIYFSQRVAPGFFAWVVPVFPGRARVGLFAKEQPLKHFRYFTDRLVAEGKLAGPAAEVCCSGVPLKPLPRTYTHRVLVVGDAAGQVKPTTGGGVYYGLLSADFAAETLNAAFDANDFSRRCLAVYEDLWKKKLGRELKIEYFARKFYNRLSDKRIDLIFNIVRDNGIHEDLLSSSRMSFDWHGELILDGMKRLSPWMRLFGRYIPAYIFGLLRGDRHDVGGGLN